jgi:hypothetical protein
VTDAGRNETARSRACPVGEDTIFKRNGDMVASHFGNEESVLFNAADRRTFLLNSTAARIYRLTDGRRNVRIVCSLIADHYPVDPERIDRDVKHIYRTFVEKGIVVHE